MDITAAVQIKDTSPALFISWNDSVYFHPRIIIVFNFRPHEVFTDLMLFSVFLEVSREHLRVHLFQVKVDYSDQVFYNLTADTPLIHKYCTAGIKKGACTCQKESSFNCVFHSIIPFNSYVPYENTET